MSIDGTDRPKWAKRWEKAMNEYRPKWAKGHYRVMRFCCRSGNCIECHACFKLEKRKRIIHTSNVSKEWAKFVTANWHSHGATMEKMERSVS